MHSNFKSLRLKSLQCVYCAMNIKITFTLLVLLIDEYLWGNCWKLFDIFVTIKRGCAWGYIGTVVQRYSGITKIVYLHYCGCSMVLLAHIVCLHFCRCSMVHLADFVHLKYVKCSWNTVQFMTDTLLNM